MAFLSHYPNLAENVEEKNVLFCPVLDNMVSSVAECFSFKHELLYLIFVSHFLSDGNVFLIVIILVHRNHIESRTPLQVIHLCGVNESSIT